MQRYFMERSKNEMQEYRENDAKIKKIVEERNRQKELCGLQQEKIRKDKKWDEGVKTYDLPDLIVRQRLNHQMDLYITKEKYLRK